ncbi:signal peptidase II [Candidatus Dependentiae bacterium]|nr:signal peptidase II [Candidatus Dependentiae bacterium]
MLKYVNYWIIFFISFFLDRITKYWIITGIIKPQVIGSCFNIYITFNRGIAWGIGSNFHSYYSNILYFFIAGLLIYFIYYLKSILHNKILSVACMLILAGGISNFIDRIWYGAVVDFLQLHWNYWYFPVFNVADVSITVGALFILYDLCKAQE